MNEVYPLGGRKYMDDASFPLVWNELQAFSDSLGLRQKLQFTLDRDLTRSRTQRAQRQHKASPTKFSRTVKADSWRLIHFTPQLLTHATKDLRDADSKDGLYGPYGTHIFHTRSAIVVGFSRPLHRAWWELTVIVSDETVLTPRQQAAWHALLEALQNSPRYEHTDTREALPSAAPASTEDTACDAVPA